MSFTEPGFCKMSKMMFCCSCKLIKSRFTNIWKKCKFCSVDYHKDVKTCFLYGLQCRIWWKFHVYRLINLIRSNTCYKNPQKLLCIDLPLPRKPISFPKCVATETGRSYFHKMVQLIMNTYFAKQIRNAVEYRD